MMEFGMCCELVEFCTAPRSLYGECTALNCDFVHVVESMNT